MNCQTLQSGPKEKFCCSGDHHTLSLSFSFITHTYTHTHTHTHSHTHTQWAFWKERIEMKDHHITSERIRESWMNFPFFDLVAIHYCTRCRIEQNSLPSVSVDCQ